MNHNRGLIYIYIVILVATFGCADNRRGMMEDNLYYSTQRPDVQIKIKDEFQYRRGATGEYQHIFINNENHRFVYIHYWPNDFDDHRVDYYEHPDHWIYEQFRDSVEIERFEMDMAGEKWYVRDAVRHVSTASCYMFRDLGVFTDMHDVLKLIYLWEMPPYVCKDWKSTDSLSDSQQQYLKEFRDGFAEDMEITDYQSAVGEEKKIVEGIIYDKQPSLESKRNAEELFAKGKSAYDKNDYEVAFATWLPLAKKGDAESAFLIAEMYYWAEGVSQNHKEAARWYLEAAERGYKEAFCLIAIRYGGANAALRKASGIDNTKDPIDAYKWFWLCSNSIKPGQYTSKKSSAEYHMKRLHLDILSDSEVRLAEMQAQKWPPKQSLRPLNNNDQVTGMKFVYVKGGCYQMGTTFGNGCLDERPVHQVCVDDFYMGKYEVTQGEYQKITGSTPSYFDKGSNYPVEQVSWRDTQEFISKLNHRSGKRFRLPTEAEWEYAARSGGLRERYSGGNYQDSLAWYDSNSGGTTHRVGTKSPNGLGLFDMSGNVWEWCSDWYDGSYYSSSPRDNPQGSSSGSKRVLRGGSWFYGPKFSQSTYRYWYAPGSSTRYFGFRLVFSEGSLEKELAAVASDSYIGLPTEYQSAESQDSLGSMYQSGEGVAQDDKEAIKWYRKAADRGSKVAERYIKEICDETPSACE